MARDQGVAPPKPIEQTGKAIPNRLYIRCPGQTKQETQLLAEVAARLCRRLVPKLSGRAAEGIKPYWGPGYFGVSWTVPYVWFQNSGTRPHTMRSLAGKVIPMWIDDPTGIEQRKNPKAKTRITVNGRRQVLIFRKAAKFGERKMVARRDGAGRLMGWQDVPKSYPGAPGRINRRNYETGEISKLLVRPHVGVRWRHPGLVPREFLTRGLQVVAVTAGLPDITCYATYERD